MKQTHRFDTRSLNIVQKLFKRIREFLGLVPPDKFQLVNPANNNQINFEIAFTLAGRNYYWVPDQTEIPAGRGLAALAIYEEMRMGVTKEYLELHCKAVKELLSQRKIDLTTLALIHNNLSQRAQLMILPDYVYKLASVVFIEQNESPFTYDWRLNQEKIELFKQHGDLSFFLTTPLRNLIPHLTLPENDIEKYLQAVDRVDKLHQQILSDVLSSAT